MSYLLSESATIRLTTAQLSALECSGLFEGPDPDSNDERILREALTSGRLMEVTAESAEAILSALTNLANAEDYAALNDSDPDMRRYARRAASALTNLSGKVAKVVR